MSTRIIRSIKRPRREHRESRPAQHSQHGRRNAGRPGYVYLMKAEGFHGPMSCVRGRYKIGLSNCPARRLNEINGSQAPCPIKGVRYIEVADCEEIEKQLHARFKKNRKHGEWFDFWVWELPLVGFAYDRRAKGTLVGDLHLPSVAIAAAGVLALGGGIALFSYVASNSILNSRNSPTEDVAR